MGTLSAVDELLQRIASEFETLPRQLQNVASYLEKQRANIMVQRINEIASGCDVHPSAVVRFAQRFGYSGFSEMQAVFRHDYTEGVTTARSYQQRIRKVIAEGDGNLPTSHMALRFIDASRVGLDELAKSLDAEQFEAAVDLLVKAENIYVVAVRRTFSIASYIVYALQHTHKRVHLVSGLGGMYREQIRSIGKNDVLIAISYPPYGKETLYCSRIAHQHKAKVLAITDSALGALGREAHITLLVNEGSAFAFRALTSTICLCQALFVALAYKLELKVEETIHPGEYDD
ncbi:MurR/RpiR family transcriptional regulator [Dyella acidisoli]|uniref:RpiR family transcriptional regulator n=1 Tax=Dyella acidisoli TaxID=1867834 RepID=A0ABQ5XQ91_9GAMM|nr:MurR/RpiR family transcriptional regulator [Dyella acidisoli]GLQ93910.1 RpiR family transcriptional regulator [Dyella acidisoli]